MILRETGAERVAAGSTRGALTFTSFPASSAFRLIGIFVLDACDRAAPSTPLSLRGRATGLGADEATEGLGAEAGPPLMEERTELRSFDGRQQMKHKTAVANMVLTLMVIVTVAGGGQVSGLLIDAGHASGTRVPAAAENREIQRQSRSKVARVQHLRARVDGVVGGGWWVDGWLKWRASGWLDRGE